MAGIRVGGDPEQYMDAPVLSLGGGGGEGEGGGGGFLANVLDLLGIGRQVAKEPKPAKAAKPAVMAPASLPVLNSAESAFQPLTPMPSDWGERYLNALKPIPRIDPNTAY